MIRPSSLWTNPDNALNQPAAGRNWDQLSAQDVLSAVMMTIAGEAAPVPVSVDARPLAIDAQNDIALPQRSRRRTVRIHISDDGARLA